MNVEFEKMKNKVEVAKAIILHQDLQLKEAAARIAELEAAITPAPTPDVTDADYTAITNGLDELFAKVGAVTPITEPTASQAESPVGDLVHPALA